ncbi:MAG: Hsp20/alpha crystallin family protein [Acidobacteriota bacterium]
MKKHERPVAFLFGEETSLPTDRRVPPVDVVEDAAGWRLVFEIPGADPDLIAVNVQGRVLTLKGVRRATDRADGLFLRVERAAGAFERVLQLPGDPDPERTRATYTDGLLVLEVPKKAASRGRAIPVVKGKKGA